MMLIWYATFFVLQITISECISPFRFRNVFPIQFNRLCNGLIICSTLTLFSPSIAQTSIDNNYHFTFPVSHAVSGGGKDYATKDIRGQDFSNQILTNKDFTQCDGTESIFRKANLNGSRFYRAKLEGADFSDADLSGASLEDTSLVDAIFTNAILQGSYLSASISEAKSLKGVDFSDALIPKKTVGVLCQRSDINESNPKTGTTTAESLFCN